VCSQALNGFLFIVTCDGEVFFASNTVEQYLGFHQVRCLFIYNVTSDFDYIGSISISQSTRYL